MNVTRHEKAASVLSELQPDTFINFYAKGHALVGVALAANLEGTEHVEFSRKEVALLARAYELTHAKGYCPYGSKSVFTLLETSSMQLA
jgi:hypothetical protein